jgi:riboflavin synthase
VFTGLIFERGTLQSMQTSGGVWRLGVEAPRLSRENVTVGDSVAVNGICLTVVEIAGAHFYLEAVSETQTRTTLDEWRIGQFLNLEPALKVGDRLDGHWVAGHVDGVARVCSIVPEGGARRVGFEAPPALAKYIAEKGSVALDGISLTVASLQPPHGFSVAIIPHTVGQTQAGAWRKGQNANLEVDLIARYLEQLGKFPAGGPLSLEKLRRAGF